MRRLRKGQKCEWPGCDKDAEYIAAGRDTTYHVPPRPQVIGVYCEEHATLVANEDYPEYEVMCPNCGCNFGVN